MSGRLRCWEKGITGERDFETRRSHATLIHKSIPTDSIVAYFNSTVSPRRLLQQNLPLGDIEPLALGLRTAQPNKAVSDRQPWGVVMPMVARVALGPAIATEQQHGG
jgi:hypothetical protein